MKWAVSYVRSQVFTLSFAVFCLMFGNIYLSGDPAWMRMPFVVFGWLLIVIVGSGAMSFIVADVYKAIRRGRHE